jgi:hypothetical protein
MIVSGRMPEEVLIDPIRDQYFSVVILCFDIEKRLAARGQLMTDRSEPTATISENWTDNTLKAISENYKLLDTEGPHQRFFYLPR